MNPCRQRAAGFSPGGVSAIQPRGDRQRTAGFRPRGVPHRLRPVTRQMHFRTLCRESMLCREFFLGTYQRAKKGGCVTVSANCFPAPEGRQIIARGVSPWKKLCSSLIPAPEGRKTDSNNVSVSAAPTGLSVHRRPHIPGLAPWAIFFRPSGTAYTPKHVRLNCHRPKKGFSVQRNKRHDDDIEY